MNDQLESNMPCNTRPTALSEAPKPRRFAVVAIVTIASVAVAGWSWIQFAERLMDVPGLLSAALNGMTEFASPDGIARRVMYRSIRG